jgi:hypothetical protein
MKTTKMVIKIFLLILMTLTIFNVTDAQTSKKDREAAKLIATRNLIDSQSFIFVPQFVSPLRGATRSLTSYYKLEVSKDSIMSYLPYFGRAYSAPYNSADLAFDFTSTNFEYRLTPGKKEAWDILIKPKNNVNTPELSLHIFDNSSASLSISSPNRDPISYQGYIKARK